MITEIYSAATKKALTAETRRTQMKHGENAVLCELRIRNMRKTGKG